MPPGLSAVTLSKFVPRYLGYAGHRVPQCLPDFGPLTVASSCLSFSSFRLGAARMAALRI